MARRIFDVTKIDVDKFFRAISLMTDISKIRLFDEGTPQKEISVYLKINNYDLALIQKKDNAIGYLLSADITKEDGPIIDANIRSISPDEKIDYNVKIDDVINKFNDYRYLFVYDKNNFAGIITYADLNRRPIHVFCYIAISEFEKLLRKFVLKKFNDDSWLNKLSDTNQREIGGIYISEKAKGVERSLLECTTLTQLKEIIASKGEWFQSLGYSSKDEFNSKIKKINDRRNSIMHGRNLILNVDGGKELFDFIYELGEQMGNINAWLNKNV